MCLSSVVFSPPAVPGKFTQRQRIYHIKEKVKSSYLSTTLNHLFDFSYPTSFIQKNKQLE